MSALITSPNIPRPDAFYEELVAAHDGLDDEQSAALNARLIFLLANQIGDQTVLTEALSAARAAGTPDQDGVRLAQPNG